MELVNPEVVDASVVGYGAATDLLVREVSPETKMFRVPISVLRRTVGCLAAAR